MELGRSYLQIREAQVGGLRVQTRKWGLTGDVLEEAMLEVRFKGPHLQGSELPREGNQNMVH